MENKNKPKKQNSLSIEKFRKLVHDEIIKFISSLDDKFKTLNFNLTIAFEVKNKTIKEFDFDPLSPPTEIV